MPKYRKLHTKITISLDFNEMPDDFTRLTWALLPLGVDREGRCLDNASLVKARLFPMRDDVAPAQVNAALDWFADHGMIERYQVGRGAYFWIPRFHEYQGDTRKESATV